MPSVAESAVDADANPYAPGFGIVPPVLAGREPEFADLEKLVRRAALRRYEDPRLLTGDRGYGKTAVLAELATGEREAGRAIVVELECVRHGDLLVQLVRQADAELRRLSLDRRLGAALATAARVLAAVALRYGVAEVQVRAATPTPHGASGDLTTDLTALLTELAEAATSVQRAVLLTVDEVQLAQSPQLAPLCAALQTLVKRAASPVRAPPVAVVFGGLPDARARIRGAASTYGERVREHRLGLLSDADVVEALVRPAAEQGIHFTDAALKMLVPATGGYPYAVQRVGYEVWDAARANPIDVADTRRGLAQASEQLVLLYRSRLDELPDREREYLAAVARIARDARTAAGVAAALDARSAEVAYLKSRLVNQRGLLREEGGRLRFTLPGLETLLQKDAT